MKALTLAVLTELSGAARAAAFGAEETCRFLVRRTQDAGPSQTKCLCSYKLADEIMDDDIKVLLFQSWTDGINRQADALRPCGRGSKQFRKLQRDFQEMPLVLTPVS